MSDQPEGEAAEAPQDPLDVEFNSSIEKIEYKSCLVTNREKVLIFEWITKLKNSDESEKALRNRFAKYFCGALDKDIELFSKLPFKTLPAKFNENLESLKYLFVSTARNSCNCVGINVFQTTRHQKSR